MARRPTHGSGADGPMRRLYRHRHADARFAATAEAAACREELLCDASRAPRYRTAAPEYI